MIFFIYLTSYNFIHRHSLFSIFSSRTRRKLLIRFYSRGGGGGYCLSISIPMSRLSNRCNSCSIPKKGKRSSESGFLSSNKESNLFKYSCYCYSIFPSTGRSTYRNGSGYFKKKKGRCFYGTFPQSTNEIQLSRLSNRCNSCSIPKKGKRSSESGFLSSNKESNLFKYSCYCYSIFPSTGRSTYRNGSGYFKKKKGRCFYGTFPQSTNEIQLMK
uniref:Ribosomal protein S16 n=1 Tax=Sophora prazeri TaxID=1323966 RepID=A0A8K1RFX1_9FABA|nr:ribosomal protein S16 [Sophora prazeri]